MQQKRPANVMAKLCIYIYFFELFSSLPPWNDIKCNVCEYKSSANKIYRCAFQLREFYTLGKSLS